MLPIVILLIAVIVSIVFFILFRRRLQIRSAQPGDEHESVSRHESRNNNNNYANNKNIRSVAKIQGLVSMQNKLKIIFIIVIFSVIILILYESVVIVEAGHRGVVLYLGAVEDRVLGEGLHFITPFAEQVLPLEVRTLKFQADASAASNDLQEVQTVIALNFHIDPNKTNMIYQQLGSDYDERIIAPTIQESVKASVAKFNAEELITKRETAKSVISDSIRKTLSERNIIVETVFITDFKFSEAFGNQIESKVVAYQKYLTEQNNLKAVQVIANQTVVQAEAQARANIAKANGESQAIRIITEQLQKNPTYLQWQAINRWNGQMPYSLGSAGFPFFQLPSPSLQNRTQ